MSKWYLNLYSVLVYVCLGGLACANQKCSSEECSLRSSSGLNVHKHSRNNERPLPIEEYIRQFGYPVEAHEITTQDGYILTYHRIPHGKTAPGDSSRPPLLLQHGLFSASSNWVLQSYSLAYTLADAGFDVWLGNSRGNTYSRKHIKYDPVKDKKAFWDFSWHEMGYYDLPAAVDYILNTTNTSQLFYVGHSMGTTMYFVLGATRPEYMDKIKAMAALAPVANLWHMKSSLLDILIDSRPLLVWLVDVFGTYEIFPHSNQTVLLDDKVCSHRGWDVLCEDVVFLACGFDRDQINRTELATAFLYMPNGASFKTLQHYSQTCTKGNPFAQFDYGYVGNMFRYGSPRPPVYKLGNVRAPIFIYYADNDWLADPTDVFSTAEHFPNVAGVIKVPFKKFNHIDFMWAREAKALLYDDIVTKFQNL